VAKLLLQYGANINTHSNEFKESALTLACYKGHLEMVKFLLSAGKWLKENIVRFPKATLWTFL
jgi:ankyrin repeat protein